MFDKNFTLVYQANGRLDAEMIKAFLESVGIPVQLNQESLGRTLGLTIGTLGLVDILVPLDKVTEARELLKEMDQGSIATSSGQEEGYRQDGNENDDST